MQETLNMRFGVVVFPGSNCDDDMIHVLGSVFNHEVTKVWHKSTSLEEHGKFDCIIVPGGFSYGDYLRSGAIARFSPIMNDVIRFANEGGVVWGICNGFQILCECGLLPGVLLRNRDQKFICKNIHLKTANNNTSITSLMSEDEVLKIPVAHADGRYFANTEELKTLEDNNQVIFRYCDENGQVNDETNINGSLNNIAGICNESRNVFGMMPHPERASEEILGNTDGKKMFESLFESLSFAESI